MTRFTLAAAALAVGVLTAGSAMAAQCPVNIKAIDAAMAANPTAAMMDEAKALRDQGEELHKAGKHAESMAALTKAKEILGIQ